VYRYCRVPLGHLSLKFGGAMQRIHHTAELDEEAVTRGLNKSAVMRGHRRIEQLDPYVLESL
jgi:hypothetical protein